MDEATASINSDTEARLPGALETLLVDRTAIVVAHRQVSGKLASG